MNNLFYITLFIFGTLMGSFASVLIYRFKSGEKGILTGRSHCGSCNKILKALELIPVVSWLKNKGACYYCKKKVSAIYPVLEISTGILFALIGYFLIDIQSLFIGNSLELITLIFWLVIGFITILYTFYDILFLEIHEGILLTGIAIIFAFLAFQTLDPSFHIIQNIPSSLSGDLGYQALVLSAAIFAGLYVIMLKGFHEIVDIIIVIAIISSLYVFQSYYNIDLGSIPLLSGVVGALGIFLFFFLQILVSRGAWMGGGDLRIALFIGLFLGIPLAAAGTMATYLIGSIIGIGFILHSKIKNKGHKLDTRIPFGPFLALGSFITIFYQTEILNYISIYF